MLSSQSNRFFSRVLPLLAAGALFGMSGCDRFKDKSAKPTTQPEVPVTVAVAQKADVDRYVDEIGNAIAIDDVAIRAQVQGTLIDVRVKDGQAVKQGDLLFQIDPRPYEAALNEARANAAATDADLTNARRDLDRFLNLPKGAASAQDEDNAKAAVDRLNAQTGVDKARINTAEINLSYTTIRAPVDGILGKVLVTAGNLVMGGVGSSSGTSGSILAQLRSVDPIYVDFTTPEKNLDAVRAAMKAGDSNVQVRAEGSTTVSYGKLTFIDNTVQADVGLVQLRATVANADRALWPGRFVRVRLILGHDKGATLIPADGVDEGEGGARAYVVKKDMTVELRRPGLGQRQPGATSNDPERVVVSSGIAPGETIVLSGRWLLGPGAKIKIVKPLPSPGGPNAATMPVTRRAAGGGGGGEADKSAAEK